MLNYKIESLENAILGEMVGWIRPFIDTETLDDRLKKRCDCFIMLIA